MALEFRLPDLGEGLTEGEIVKWLVKVGERVQEGQPFVQVETDKALVEIPAPSSGVVLAILAQEGERVQVGRVIAVFGESGEKVSAPPPERAPTRPTSVGVVGSLEEAPEEEPEGISPRGEGLALPAVRKLAKELGVDLRAVTGSGPQGRITEQDVRREAELKAKPKAKRKYDLYGYVERIPLRGMRRTIAEAMVRSASTAAQVTATEEADATRILALRDSARQGASSGEVKLTLLPFLVKAVARALQEHPYLNSSLDDEAQEIILKRYYNIGVAVDTSDGLMVPVIKGVTEKTVLEIAREMTQLAQKARSRTIDLADLEGGTFTVTNYGSVGGILGTPIIRHPEAAILGVGRVLERPVVRAGEIHVVPILPLSLSFDHRVVDGAEAARFLNTLIRLIQEPGLILVGT
ncbi:MAG: dihydrolipoamide acetyltransferase family protein [Thermodesulfobacteriota bacterium]